MRHDTGALLRKRNTSLDMTRVVAIAAVVMIHVCTDFVINYDISTPEFKWGNIFDGFARVGVPLFVMTSGALLLDEEMPFTIHDLFTRRLPQIIILLISWSAIYAVGYQIAIPLLKRETISLKSLVDGFVLGHYHLWYLYMVVGLYLALPFLRIIVCRKNKNLIAFYLAISILFQFSIPLIRILFSHFDFADSLITLITQFQLGFFNVFVSYFLAGWYIVHVGIPKKSRIALYAAAILSLCVIIVYVNFTKDYANAYSNSGILVFVYSSGTFLALNSTQKKPGSGKIISILSKCSFGIYATHVVLLEIINILLPKTLTAPIYLLVCWILTFAASLLATFVLSKIPYFKKLVRM